MNHQSEIEIQHSVEAPMIAIKKILVATDFGPASETALAYGRAFALQFNASLHVLHVMESVAMTAATEYGFSGLPIEYQLEIEAAARKSTDDLLTDEDRQLFSAVAAVVRHNTPAAAIVDYARTNDIDLIFIGTHGRGAFGHLLMGSVAERVVRTAPCPVLAVRNPEHEFVLPDALVAVSHD
jgi:nucleotide-binding universal stress UspA family protein